MILQKYASYKDSGVEWLGGIPEQWEIKRLKDLGPLQNGISEGAEYFGSGTSFVSYSDVYNNRIDIKKINGLAQSTEQEQRLYSVKENDVFFTRTSETIVEIAISSTCFKTIPKSVFSGFVIRLRPSPYKIYKGFSKYFFNAEIHRNFFVKEMKIVTRASLSQGLLNQLPILLPDIKLQIRISSFLDKKTSQIDSKIKILQEKIISHEDLKKSLINETVCRGLNKNIGLKDSEIEWIGKIPQHWKVERLKNFVYLKGRIGWKALKNEEYIDEGYALLTSYNLIKGKKFVNFFNKTHYIPKWRYDESPEIMVRKNDILMSKIEGRLGYVKKLEQESTINSSLMLIRTNHEPLLNSFFLFYVLDSNSFLHFFNISQNGSAMQSISQEDVRYFKFAYPPKKEQIEIANYLDEKTNKIDTIISKIKDQIETLKEFRKTLINDVVTGKVRIQNE